MVTKEMNNGATIQEPSLLAKSQDGQRHDHVLFITDISCPQIGGRHNSSDVTRQCKTVTVTTEEVREARHVPHDIRRNST